MPELPTDKGFMLDSNTSLQMTMGKKTNKIEQHFSVANRLKPLLAADSISAAGNFLFYPFIIHKK